MRGAVERDLRRRHLARQKRRRVKDVEASLTRGSDAIDDSQREIERSHQLIKDADKQRDAVNGKQR
jgi:hypothetical protein